LTKIDKRKTPEHREHLKKIGRKKGDPKIPGSGRKPTPPEVKAAMAERTLDAVAIMEELMRNSTNESVRQKAAAYFIDAMVSKAPAQQNVEVKHTHQLAGMLAEVNALRLADNSKTIDITPNQPEPVLIEADEDDNEDD
jgi:hypothetical protein